MKSHKYKWVMLLLAQMLLTSTFAKVYYVSPLGNDTNIGETISSPFQSINKALTAATQVGDTVFLSEGLFQETNQISIPKGVSLIGQGKDKTTIKVDFFYDMLLYPQKNVSCSSLINPDRYSYNHSSNKFVIQVTTGYNQTIKGFYLEGQNKKCHGGIFSDSSAYVVYDDLKIENFRFSGIWLAKSKFTEIQNCVIRNNTFGNSNNCTGNVMFYDANNTNIHHNLIEETVTGCYGIKSYSKRWTNFCFWTDWIGNNSSVTHKLKIFNNTIRVNERGEWENGSAPAITIEFQATSVDSCEIYNNTLNNHVSLVGNYPVSTTGFVVTKPSVHLYNNFFDLGTEYRYAVEANMPNIEFDHNYVNGGLYPIAQWESNRSNFVNQNFHHNVFYAQWGGQPILSYKKDPGIKFDNNTVIDVNGISGLLKANATFKFNHTSFKNNIFMSTRSSAKFFDTSILDTIDVKDNLFYNVIPLGESYLQQSPELHMVGDRPIPYFLPKKGSPVIEKSIGAYLYDAAYDFASVDNKIQNNNLKIFTSQNNIYILSESSRLVNIYSIEGKMVETRKLTMGLNTFTVSPGFYVIVSGNDKLKVVI